MSNFIALYVEYGHSMSILPMGHGSIRWYLLRNLGPILGPSGIHEV